MALRQLTVWEFVSQLIDLKKAAVCQAAQKHRSTLKNPPKTPDEYLDTLNRQGLPQSATTLRSLCDEI